MDLDGNEAPGTAEGWGIDRNKVFGAAPAASLDAYGHLHWFAQGRPWAGLVITRQACFTRYTLPPRPHLAKPVVAPAALAPRARMVLVRSRLHRGRAYLPNPLIAGAAPPIARPVIITQARQAALRLVTIRPQPKVAKPIVAQPAGPAPVPRGLVILANRVRRALATVPLKPKLAPAIVRAAPRGPPALIVSRTAKLQPPFVPPRPHLAKPVVAIGPAATTRPLVIQARYRVGRGRVIVAKPVIAVPGLPPVPRGTFIFARFKGYRGKVFLPNPYVQGAAPPLPVGLVKTVRYLVKLPPRPHLAPPVVATSSVVPLAPRAIVIQSRFKGYRGHVLTAKPVITPVPVLITRPLIVKGRFTYTRGRVYLPKPVIAPARAPTARAVVIQARFKGYRGKVYLPNPLIASVDVPLPPVPRGLIKTVRWPLPKVPLKARTALPVVAPPPSTDITMVVSVIVGQAVKARLPRPRKAIVARPVILTTAPAPLAPAAVVITTQTQYRLPPKPHLARPVLGQPVVSRGTFIHGVRTVIKLPPRPHLALPIVSLIPLANPVPRGTFISGVARLRPAPAPIRPHLAPAVVGAHVEIVAEIADPIHRPRHVLYGKGTIEFSIELGTAAVARHYGDEDRHRQEENWLVLGIAPSSWDDHADD